MGVDLVLGIGQASEELAELAERVRSSVVVVHGPRGGAGSGVVWDDEGLVVTNHHVAPGPRAEVDDGAGARTAARVVARSEHHDLAALRLDRPLSSRAIRPAEIGDSTSLRVGELVIAVGNPLGERNAVTVGMVSAGPGAPGHGRDGHQAIRLAMTLRPGNSGGALADLRGRVVGIPHMVVGAGLALAVPSHLARRLLQEGREGHTVFGIAGQWVELPERLARAHELPHTRGLLVLGVEPGSPADRAGLVLGDLIVAAYAHDPLADEPGGLLERLGAAPAGSPVRLTLVRGGTLRWVDCTPVRA